MLAKKSKTDPDEMAHYELSMCIGICFKSTLPSPIIKYLGPVVQSIISLTSSLMTNSLTVRAKVVSNMLTFLLQKCE